MGCACSKGVLGRSAVSPSPEDPPCAQGAPLPQEGGPKGYQAKRRGSVSAEPSGNRVKKPSRQSIAKPDQARDKIRGLVLNTLLLKELDEDQQSGIIDAMVERRVEAGEVIIREGEEAGDSANFFVIESGRFAATKAAAGPGAGAGAGAGEPAATYEGCGSFGELALMYNCPRAATVTALSEGVLWGVDRATFRSLVVYSMAERRKRYEATLRGMPIFRHLSPEQLAAVADCLHQEVFEVGQYILCEDAPLDNSAKFYMVESGSVDCFRTFEGQKRAVKRLGAGDVFGEVALLTNAPRQADCVAATRCKCLTLSREAFERLMGPVEQVLAHQIAQYAQSNQAAQEEAAAAAQGAAPAGDGGAGAVEEEAGSEEEEVEEEGAAQSAAEEKKGEEEPATAAPSPAGAATATTAPAGQCAAALLPGSPRPPLRLSDTPGGASSGSFSYRRSTRGTHSTASCEMESAGSGGSPSALPMNLHHPHQQQGSSAEGSSTPAAVTEGSEAAAAAAAQDGSQGPPAVCLLPPIAEEPAEAAPAAAAAGGRPSGASSARRSTNSQASTRGTPAPGSAARKVPKAEAPRAGGSAGKKAGSSGGRTAAGKTGKAPPRK